MPRRRQCTDMFALFLDQVTYYRLLLCEIIATVIFLFDICSCDRRKDERRCYVRAGEFCVKCHVMN